MDKLKRRVFIAGVGMTKFLKPGNHPFSYIDLGKQATIRALIDSQVKTSDISHAFAGYVFNESCAGQRVLYDVGICGIPIVNVNNNCATGSTAFNLAYSTIQSGMSDCALALGFDKMEKGALKLSTTPDAPTFKYFEPLIRSNRYKTEIPPTPQIFGSAGLEHMEKYGTTFEQLSKISVKNYDHGSRNPYAQFNKKRSETEIKDAQMICYPLTKLHCCPTSDGAACAVLISEDFMVRNNLQNQAVEVLASVLQSDMGDSFDRNSMIDIVGSNLTRRTANKAYVLSNTNPSMIDVVELHDCFSANELLTYESLGLCEVGQAGRFIDNGDNTFGGRYVVNPSGGLTCKGHPLGATGLAQITELTWQLRGMSEERQVKNARIALAHNLGLGSAVVVSILRKYNDSKDYKVLKSSNPREIEKLEELHKGKFRSITPKF